MAVPDEETGGALGPTGCARTTTPTSNPSTSSTRAGSGAATSLPPASWCSGHLGRGEEDPVAQAPRRGDRRPRLAAARSRPERSAHARARAAAQRAAADLVVRRPRDDEGPRRTAGGQQVQQRHPTLDHLDHEPAIGVGDPPKANVIPSVAEATLDCRVLPGTTKDQWLAEIRRRLGDPEYQDRDHLRRGGSDRHDAGLGAGTARSSRR